MSLRQILKTIRGQDYGLDKNNNGVWNRVDGSQVVLESDLVTGQPKVRTVLPPALGGTEVVYPLIPSAGTRGGALPDYDITEARIVEETGSYMTTLPAMPLTDQTGNHGTGNGNIVEPSALWVPEGWNGYEWWLVASPYDGSNANYENPVLQCTHDPKTGWVLAPSIPSQPLLTPPVGGHCYDSGIFWAPDRSSMIIVTCVLTAANTASVYCAVWSGQGQPVFTQMGGTSFATSSHYLNTPCVFYDPVNSQMVMYVVDIPGGAAPGIPSFMTSPVTGGNWQAALTSGWSAPVAMTANGVAINGTNTFAASETSVWHYDLKQLSSGVIVGLVQTGNASGGRVYPCRIPTTNGAPGTTDMQIGAPLRPLNKPLSASVFYRSAFVATAEGWVVFIGTIGLAPWASPSCALILATVKFDRSSFHAALDAKLASASAATSGVANTAPKLGGLVCYDDFGTGTTLGAQAPRTGAATWTVDLGAFDITAGSGYVTGHSATNNKAHLVGPADCDVRSTWQAAGANTGWMMFRGTDTSNYWRVSLASGIATVQQIKGGSVVIPKLVGNSNTAASSGNVACDTSDANAELWAHCVGPSVRIYYQRLLIAEVLDAFNVGGTWAGIQISDTSTKCTSLVVTAAS